MGKVALIVPNNLWVCPYVIHYSQLLDSIGVEYEIISWNRARKLEAGIQYNRQEKSRNLLGVLYAYFLFSKFVKKCLNKSHYDKIVVFSPQLAIFLAGFLTKHYSGQYIVDYRDLSIEQKAPFGHLYKKALRYSYANVISSPGFLKYLPKEFRYVVSHNFKMVDGEAVGKRTHLSVDMQEIKVLTIGAIREDCNREVMDALGNVEGFSLQFVGKGIAAQSLEEYAKAKGYKNIVFTGYYDKKDEPSIIKDCSMINIVYPLVPSHISALSNRFYNSLIFGRPMIVTRNTIQGDYAEQYNVGLTIDTCEHLASDIKDYLTNLDFDSYCNRCDGLLLKFVDENRQFEEVIKSFVVA